MPSFAVNSFIALCVVILAVSLLGFVAGLLESKTALEAYTFILTLSAILMLIYASLLTYYSEVFDQYYSANWGDLMLYIHRDFFTVENMGCYGGKYYLN